MFVITRVLTRRRDQGLVISGNIYVRVLGLDRDRVKISVSAPAEVTVIREERLSGQSKNHLAEAKEQG